MPHRLRVLAAALASLLLYGCGPRVGEPAPRLADVLSRLDSLVRSAPERAELRDIGFGASAERPGGDPDLPIRSIRIRGEDWDEGDPVVQVLGCMHGNEPLGAGLALALAELALGLDARSPPESLAGLALDILPVANPRGYEADSRFAYDGSAEAYVDPNRAFTMDYGPGQAGPAPTLREAAVLADDAANEHYAISISLHTGAYLVCVPWDYIGTTAWGDPAQTAYTLGDYVDSYSPAHPWLLARGASYAALVEAATGGRAGSFPLVQGYDWYYAGGTYGDWLYLRLGTASFTIELSPFQGADSAGEEDIAWAAAVHLDALTSLASAARLGASGLVLAPAGSGAPARVEARPVSAAKAPWIDPVVYLPFAYSDPASGSFRIPLQTGRWELTASAEGYAPVSATVEIDISGVRDDLSLQFTAP
jgi:hypothetical protein